MTKLPGFNLGMITLSYSVHRCFTCLGFIPSFLVAFRQARFLAVGQSAAVAVAKAKRGKPGFTLSGMLSSASALQLQVHPREGFAGLAIDLSAPRIGIFIGDTLISSSGAGCPFHIAAVRRLRSSGSRTVAVAPIP